MSTHTFHEALGRASLGTLEQVIDWLERPWQPTHNDALRAAWHRARRDPSARGALHAALEREVLGLHAAEARHVARALGIPREEPTAGDVLRAITARLEPSFGPPPVRSDLGPLTGPLVELAGRVLRAALREPPPRRHRGGGRRHGRP